MSLKQTEFLVKTLISFQTTSNNTREIYECLEWLKKSYEKKLPLKVLDNKKHPILLMGQTNLKATKVLFLAHLDVVEGKKKQFKPIKRGNKIYGRGATDNKGSVVALLEITENLYPKFKDITLVLTFDEEISGKSAELIAKKIKGNSDLKCVFVPDAGGNFKICIEALGVWHFKVKFRGKSAHASDPYEGKNAIEESYKFLSYIKKLSKYKGDAYKIHSINLGKIKGGNSINSVPDSAEAYYDVRFKSNSGLNKFRTKVESYLKARKHTLEDLIVIGPFHADKKHPLFLKFISFLKLNHIKPIFYTETSSNDARFFAQKSAVIVTKPKGGNAHSDNEWVELNSIEKYKEIVSNFLIENVFK